MGRILDYCKDKSEFHLEQDDNKFVALSRCLFGEDSLYINLSMTARVMYSFMRDRSTLSHKNEWVDEDGVCYFYYTQEELCKLLGVSRNKVVSAMNELKDADLLVSLRQGLNRPNRLYVKKLVSKTSSCTNEKHPNEQESNIHGCTREVRQDVDREYTNYTNIIYTNKNYTEKRYTEDIEEKEKEKEKEALRCAEERSSYCSVATQAEPSPSPTPKRKKKDKYEGMYLDEVKEVIDHLNEKVGSKCRATSKENRGYVIEAIEMGYTVSDLKEIVNIMCTHWYGDEEMHMYLRPSTLWRKGNLEKYLSTPRKIRKTQDGHVIDEYEYNIEF